ncbi:MAG: helix-turn-helix transcriptional regulator [Muribaculaceae bacterium]|nr:helix-turn-helix transcriptional regulator [Muribaculaceae bacterium]
MTYLDNFDSVHIGEEIRKRLDSSGMPYKDFASRLHCTRSALYHLFRSKSIDTEKLITISRILNYDFITKLYTKPGELPEIYIAVPAGSSLLESSAIEDHIILQRLSEPHRKQK